MKAYWDTSALIKALADAGLRDRLEQEGGITRTHSLAEMFSALTGGNLSIRLTADDAAAILEDISQHLEFVSLDSTGVLKAFTAAQRRGVRGARVHDYLHAVAAVDHSHKLLTCDRNDFNDLVGGLEVEQV
ncbi:MAG: PIN domain-containing protein [Verrucomicrobiales bacterium]|nr:PIN domain-containing protein [Verrucomicrobiales bacterium]